MAPKVSGRAKAKAEKSTPTTKEATMSDVIDTPKSKSDAKKAEIKAKAKAAIKAQNVVEKVAETPEGELKPRVIVPQRTNKKTLVWMDLQAGKVPMGRVVIELFSDVPLAAENFRALCTGEVTDPNTGEPLHYAGTRFNMALEGEYIMGGDVVDPDGAGSMSIYGGPFEDEPAGLARLHDAIGLVSMFTTSRNGNDSKFMISLRKRMKWLDGQSVVVGKVVQGMKAVFRLSEFADDEGKPECNLFISACGRLKKAKKDKETEDGDEADIEADDEDKIQRKTEDTTVQGTTKKPNCEKCGSATAYIRRVSGRGISLKCKNNECKHNFWAPDDKISPEEAARALAEREDKRTRRHAALMKHIEIKKKAIADREARKAEEKAKRAAEKAALKLAQEGDKMEVKEKNKNDKKTDKSEKVVESAKPKKLDNADDLVNGEKFSKVESGKTEKPQIPSNAILAGNHLKASIISAYEESKVLHEKIETARKNKRVELAIKAKELKSELKISRSDVMTDKPLERKPKMGEKKTFDKKFGDDKKIPEKKSFEQRPFEKKPFEKKTFEKKPFEKKPFEKKESEPNAIPTEKKEKRRWRDLDESTQKELREKSVQNKEAQAMKESEAGERPVKRTKHFDSTYSTRQNVSKPFIPRNVDSNFADRAIAAKINAVGAGSDDWRTKIVKK